MISQANIDVNALSKTYNHKGRSTPVLTDISLKVAPHEFVSIVGPSACGKSTLLNILAGLEEQTSGSASVTVADSSSRLGQVAYMPQNDSLLPWRSVIDNAALPLEVRGMNRRDAREIILDRIDEFGLNGFEDFLPANLSGGMRQRVALLRTMMTDQEVLLLDEPFGALDALTRGEMQERLLKLWQGFKKTILLVTHDVDEALLLSDRIYVFSARPGRINKTFQVNLPRPRTYEIFKNREFINLKTEMLLHLKKQNHTTNIDNGK